MLGSYLARLSSVSLRSAGRKRLGILDEVRLPLRIWPTDIDVYLHVNNGRYLTLMDFGRLVHTVRTGLLPVMLRRRWIPVLGSATVNFWRELRTFERVELVTRLVHWDDRWFYYEHRFEKGGEAYALGLVKGIIKHGRQTIAPAVLMQAMGHSGEPPPPGDYLRQWMSAQPERPRRRVDSAGGRPG